MHWVVQLRGYRAPLVLDEINWWPLALPIKCRHVLAPDARLSGPDRDLLARFSQAAQQNPEGLGRFYPWLSAEKAAQLDAIRPRGVLLNRSLKQTVVDWELADVLLA